jgi:uncharacterized membrane protein
MNENLNYKSRIQSIDLLRGVIIILMALDHVRDFLGPTLYNPLDLSQTSIALFFTRWITNLCAPTFIFLTGVSAYLYGLKVSKKALSIFLIKRGIFLIVLELTIVNFAWSFSFATEIVLQVIWLLGNCMIFLAVLCWLPRRIILILSLLVIFCHNLFDAIKVPEPATIFSYLWSYLHVLHKFNWPHFYFEISYPLIPWAGVMALGYCLGSWMQLPVSIRTKKFCLLGLGCLLLFLVMRYINVYGDPARWAPQARGMIYTVLSFLNTTKYPPSLFYVLLNIGIVTLLWPLWENWRGRSSQIVITFGKVAMFFYIIHVLFIHFIAKVNSEVFLHTTPGWWWSDDGVVVFPSTYHFSLLRVYVIWLAVLIVLYPVCSYYKRYKATHNYAWLKYL